MNRYIYRRIQQNAEIVRHKGKQKKPSIGDSIKYCAEDSDIWFKAEVLGKRGKTSGKNWSYRNIQDENKIHIQV